MPKIKESIRSWLLPISLLLVVAVFSISSALIFQSTEERYVELKSRQIANAIALHLQQAIHNHATTIKILASSEHLFQPQTYKQVAQSMMTEYPDYLAINLVNPKGKIEYVYPLDVNKKALGQNLLDRSDVQNYLLEAQSGKTPQMSHKLITYQGVPAFTLYVPLYDSKEKFIGWLNGVVDFDQWIIKYLNTNELKNIRIIIRWDRPDSAVIDHGHQSIEKLYHFTHSILNQHVQLSIGFAKDQIDHVRNRHFLFAASVASGIVMLAMILIVLLNRSRLRLNELNESLALKNNLLSSLSHDMSTPLNALGITLEPILENKQLVSEHDRSLLTRLLKNIYEMLKSVRILHAQDLGRFKIEMEPVPLKEAIQNAVTSIDSVAKSKDIKIQVEPIPSDVQIRAQRSILVNNVLLNVLSNAVKFSSAHDTVTISVHVDASKVSVHVDDEGLGLEPDQIAAINSAGAMKSVLGTKGESGTGLGLLQVRYFMKVFGGSVVIANRKPKGCRVTLKFYFKPR